MPETKKKPSGDSGKKPGSKQGAKKEMEKRIKRPTHDLETDEPDTGSNDRFISFKIGEKVISEVIDGNIQLSELTPDELKNALNRAVGKFAYYGSMRADAKRLEAKFEAEYKAWRAVKMNEISHRPDFAKATGTAIDIQVQVENVEEIEAFERKKRDIAMITDKLYVLIQSFELMTRTVQSVMAMARAELESAGRGGYAHGGGDLADEG